MPSTSETRPPRLLHRLTATAHDPLLFCTRLTLAVIFFPHGAQKVLGWFGGPGFQSSMNLMAGPPVHAPAWLALLAIAAEFLGAIGLAVGLFGRIAALGIVANMVVAALVVHLPNGFFMNWTGAQKGEGFEFHLLAISLALVIVVRGSGAWSLDRFLLHRKHHRAGVRYRLEPLPLIASADLHSPHDSSLRHSGHRHSLEGTTRP